VLDGELVCLRADGRPNFMALLGRQAPAYFCAFDLLALDGEDLRDRPLLERKRRLRRIVPRRSDRLRYVDHIRGRGVDLFRLACERDLEGIVAKWAPRAYRLVGRVSPWVKIKNRDYTQARDRHELFDGFRQRAAR
jgi:bifunctional non-homologous end joining protein LigD